MNAVTRDDEVLLQLKKLIKTFFPSVFSGGNVDTINEVHNIFYFTTLFFQIAYEVFEFNFLGFNSCKEETSFGFC